MKIKNGKIAEATESELFGVYLKRGFDDIMSFIEYKRACEKNGTKIIEEGDEEAMSDSENKLHKAPAEDAELEFGDRLKAVRKARGLTQKQLAEKAGIRQSMISLYERNKVLPGAPALEWMCKVLDVKASDLLGF